MTTRGPALCWACQRRTTDTTVAKCEAFPDGIPFEIITLSGDHHEPVEGDHGLQFAQADTDAARTAFADWQAYNEGVRDMDETEELDEETTNLEDDPEPHEPLDPAAVRRALDEGSLRLRGIIETRVAGKDVTPGNDRLHHYWTKDPRGLAKWVKSLHPATALHRHLMKYVGSERAWRMANEWHKEVFGIYPGEKKGQNPLGPG